jgi:hypothetical protein
MHMNAPSPTSRAILRHRVGAAWSRRCHGIGTEWSGVGMEWSRHWYSVDVAWRNSVGTG